MTFAEQYLSLVYDRLHELLNENKVIHVDETPVKVMLIDGEKIKNGKQSYMWVYRDSPVSDHPSVLFDWQPSRSTDHPREFLKEFSGIVITEQAIRPFTVGHKNFVLIESCAILYSLAETAKANNLNT